MKIALKELEKKYPFIYHAVLNMKEKDIKALIDDSHYNPEQMSIELTINGHPADLATFNNNMESQWKDREELLKKEARELINTDAGNLIEEFSEAIRLAKFEAFKRLGIQPNDEDYY